MGIPGEHRIALVVEIMSADNGLVILFVRIQELPRRAQNHAVDVVPEPVVDRKSIVPAAPGEFSLVNAVRRNQNGESVDFRLFFQRLHGGRFAEDVPSGFPVDQLQRGGADREKNFRFPAGCLNGEKAFSILLVLSDHGIVLFPAFEGFSCRIRGIRTGEPGSAEDVLFCGGRKEESSRPGWIVLPAVRRPGYPDTIPQQGSKYKTGSGAFR